MAKKAKQSKAKRGAKKITVKAKLAGKKAAPKRKGTRKAARKPGAPNRAVRQAPGVFVFGDQSVETVPMKGRARTAAAGAGGGDFGGASVVEGVDSESADELLEEGQTFEAGIVSGVEDAPDADQGEVRTHEVPQEDVPEEYDDKDRP
jgi:hypothetical protein